MSAAPQPSPGRRRRSGFGYDVFFWTWLLQNISVTPIPQPDLRRVLLGTRALEIIGTPRARELRRQLVERPKDAFSTRQP